MRRIRYGVAASFDGSVAGRARETARITIARTAAGVVVLLLVVAGASAADQKTNAKPASPRFEISFPKEMSATPLDGHVLLVISNNNDKEPRFQVSFITPQSQQVFGVDVEALRPGAAAVVDASTLGYPA